ncbi:imidazole glycerol phosphate synthase subunit HisF [Picrophilus oshimae]|uniref:Imidazole glycerol phosphate synthase subunit HisF n=1 Tax=Picrophilus torridus (strain ATCC 700027 / DSM 9790 / JCM 10055 / NBRC 100828 / KAW 2/3) TaxID=1122961 RepID=Q6KZD5_PICTO|nr:imidazole glycerol phosphate synthase subunit HisF [Picrophilus oshimae]AAT43917.1 histidine biosynthesis protein HisF [Picrophilus oshimae DSM 9789]
MLAKRIIAALDVRNGRVVKGVRFMDIKDAGDPVENAVIYQDQGADEIVFLDISATDEKRDIMIDLVKSVSRELNIPFTVGGGIRSVKTALNLLREGCDKVFLNTYAIENPWIIKEISRETGSANLVIAVDAMYNNGYYVYKNAGRINSGLKLNEWLPMAEYLGAGEILLTSIDSDGTMKGFDNRLISEAASMIDIPVIASGGAGKPEHFLDAFMAGASGALAASILHFKINTVNDIKRYLRSNGVNVRL